MRLRGFRGAALTAGVAAGMAVGGGAASAQVLEEIVVTARARGESVQSVPLAITAFSNEDLQKRAVVDMGDISRMTPGFSFENYGTGSTAPVIRGATQIAGSVEQPVSFFLDGVYLPREYITDIGFWGIQRVEVVKGPQSARYGRNAFSGAVNYVTRSPTDTYQAEVEATAGIYSRYDLSGLVSGPIVPGKVSFIAGASRSTFDGSWKNSHPFCDIDFSPGTNCRVGGYDKTAYNLGLEITPIDRLKIDYRYFKFMQRREQGAITRFGELNSDSGVLNCGVYNPTVRPPGPGLGSGGQWYRLYCGELPVKPLPIDPRGYGSQLNANFSRVGLTFDITDDLQLTYVFGHVSARNERNQYNDHLPDCPYLFPGQCLFSTVGASSTRSNSHDVRLTFDNGGIIRVAVGYLYAPTRDLTYNAFASAPPLTAVPTSPLYPGVRATYGTTYSVLSATLTESEISSPFAEVQLSLFDSRLRLGAEGRYTQEKRYQQALASGGSGGVLAFSGAAFRATYYSFTPRFTVDYKLTPDHLLYASAAKGVKAGGFNTTAFLPENRVYKEDSNWTYEVGVKNTWGPLRLNANLFLIKWKDMQIPAADPGNPAPLPVSIVMNLGNLTSKGVEADAQYAVSRRLTFSGTAYYGRSTYDDGTFHLVWARTPPVCDNIVCPTNGEISGKQSPRAPEFMGTFATDWRDKLPVRSGLEYYLHADLSYQSKAYADEMNLAWVAPRLLVNATAGLTGDKWGIQFWVRNLLDEKYNSVASIQQPNVAYLTTIGDRRTLGVTLSAHY